jgi:N-acetyl-anhydromuramyl-L-alanine amidase AmpD
LEIIETDWKWNGTLSKRASTEYIALHHAEAVSCTAEDIDRWHKENGWAGIGYHFFVRKNGKIYRGRPLDSLGAHVQGKNNVSVGVCAEGDYHNKDKEMPQAQKKSIKELIAYLKGIYPSAAIVGHGEIGSSSCPGQYYPLDEMKNYMKGDDEMTQEERDKLNAVDTSLTNLYATVNTLIERISKLEAPVIYNYVDDNMPDWAREAVQAAIDKGALKGEGEGLGLTYSDLRTIVREYRMGMYK